MPRNITKKYSNEEITVVWKPGLCMHSMNCWKSLLPVFDPRRKPWIIMDAAASEKIIDTVNNCPSKALSYFKNDQSGKK